MTGRVDLHCHCLPGVDDGVDTWEESLELLKGLLELGFEQVVATPHMRPGLFDTPRERLEETYHSALVRFQNSAELPRLSLSCEHFFDDVVFQRLRRGEGIPYPGGHAVLVEFLPHELPSGVDRMIAQVRQCGLTPVIAHPERYQVNWKGSDTLERLLDLGAVALLDLGAVVGKYGRQPQACAERLLEEGLYFAACSDAHHPRDLVAVAAGMRWVEHQRGTEELQGLLSDGPRDILAGTTQG